MESLRLTRFRPVGSLFIAQGRSLQHSLVEVIPLMLYCILMPVYLCYEYGYMLLKGKIKKFYGSKRWSVCLKDQFLQLCICALLFLGIQVCLFISYVYFGQTLQREHLFVCLWLLFLLLFFYCFILYGMVGVMTE